MGQSQTHHVVSRGYQRLFADGEHILLIHKQSKKAKPVGTRDAFHAPRFNSFRTPAGWDDSLEEEWARIEGLALPAVRRLAAGVGTASDRDTAKVVAGIHLARSVTFQDWHLKITAEVTEGTSAKFETDPQANALFEDGYGRRPRPGEISALVERQMTAINNSKGLFVERMVHIYNKARERIESTNVQLLMTIGKMEWVIGDTPVITANNDLTRLHSNKQLAIFEGEAFFMPLGRRVGMTLFGRAADPDQYVPADTCQKINWLMWRNCRRFLACHPAADPCRLLAAPISRAHHPEVAKAVNLYANAFGPCRANQDC